MTRLSRRALVIGFAGLTASSAGLSLLSTSCAVALFGPTSWKVPRIGFLSPGPREARAESFVDPFLAGLRDLGYVEGHTIAIEWRFTSEGRDAQFPEMAVDLVRLPVDVIVASATPASLAARNATTTIPIVASGVPYPVQTGLLASLARTCAAATRVSSNRPA